nr:hypothetical protein [Moraxella osloensis]
MGKYWDKSSQLNISQKTESVQKTAITTSKYLRISPEYLIK